VLVFTIRDLVQRATMRVVVARGGSSVPSFCEALTRDIHLTTNHNIPRYV
jgi:hypothetical protein